MAIKEIRFQAKYIKINEIEVLLSFDQCNNNKVFTLVVDGVAKEVLSIKSQVVLNDRIQYILNCSPIELGHRLQVADETYQKVVLDVRPACDFPSFDGEYTYDGDDLGAIYSIDKTSFALWAPLCSQVNLVVNNDRFKMERGNQGVYKITLVGDFDGAIYYYEVIINDILTKVTDPYGIGSTSNSRESVVISLQKCKINLNEDKLPRLNSYVDAIIYELSVRDFTSFSSTNIAHKGQFLGLVEENRVNEFKDPVGLDYLKSLKVSHVQIMPIYDFYTVDEDNPSASYNWGYDPRQYNVPEGSYSSNPKDPYKRIIELKKMIAKLHKKGIKVNMDVVYNHVYAYEYSVFETVVPNYYFRKKLNGEMSNGSYCGNDFDSTRPMARKFILDSVAFWMKEYGIDGFRFDLMSIIDIRTMQDIVNVCRSIKSDCMLYGEGWNVPTALIDEKKSSMLNAFKLPDVAFFNDLYRDSLKGKSMDNEMKDKGYLMNNPFLRGAFKYAYRGSSIRTSRMNMFINPTQSINYLECHDNATLFDKIKACYEMEEEEDILRRLKFINAVHLFALGVPFIHMGQEIGLSKNGNTNSYNSGDLVNQFNYDLLSKRKSILKHFIDAIDLRLGCPFFHMNDTETIKKTVSFINLDNGGVIIKFSNKGISEKDLLVAINPSEETSYFDFDEYYRVIFNEAGKIKGDLFMKSLILSKHNVIVLRQE